MEEPNQTEIGEKCSTILNNLKDGKSPSPMEIKLLASSDIVSRNMRSPSEGPIGELVSTMMESVNLKISKVSAEQCNLVSGETVLEIGTGGHGYAMEVLLQTSGLTKLVGIEISDYLRNKIVQKFSKEIEKEKLVILDNDCKDLSDIFPNNNTVDCILAINVVYFLNPLEIYLQEMYRILKPRTGRVLLACKNSVSKQQRPPNSAFKNVDFEEICLKCRDVGFKVEVENMHFDENSLMNDFTLIKLYKE